MCFASSKGIWIPDFREILPVGHGILGFGVRNTALGFRNLSSSDKDPECTAWNLESKTRGVLPYMTYTWMCLWTGYGFGPLCP